MRRLVAAIAVAAETVAAARASARPHPCQTTPEFRQLDFWVGEWDVTHPSSSTGAGSRAAP